MHLPTMNMYSIIGVCISLVLIVGTTKYLPKIPAALVGLIGSTAVAALFFPNEVATIGSTYSAIPNTLPSMQFTWACIQLLIGPALVIAMLDGIESLLSVVVADELTGTKHNSNKELIGQGVANMVTPLF